MANRFGTDGNDTLTGTADGDTFFARGGSDSLFGGGGDDVFILETDPAGSDTIDGGSGTDGIFFETAYTDYILSFTPGTDGANGFLVLTHNADGSTETVSNVEQLGFTDQVVLIVGGGSEYERIQEAVDAAGANGATRILVADGTYTEQLVIDGIDNLTIEAINPGQVTIQAPPDVVETSRSGSDREIHAVVTVEDSANVVLRGITVDGAGAGNTVDEGSGAGQANFYGVFYRNASGGLEDVDVTGVRDAYPGGTTVGGEPIQSGNQRGVGVVVDNDAPGMGEALLAFSMTGGSIADFQKNATVFNYADLDISGVTITGGGAQPINAQNGIQVLNSTGSVSGNTITEIGYAGPAFAYSGAILAYGNTNLDITNNTIEGTNNDTLDAKVGGIFLLDFGSPDFANSGGEISGNTISFVDFGIDISGLVDPDGILIENNSITDIDVTDQFAAGVSFAPDETSATPYDVDGSGVADFLFGAAGDDVLAGLAGDDELGGGAGADDLDGGDGDDTLEGGEGDDDLDGGEGGDTAVFEGNSGDYTIGSTTGPNGRITGFTSVADNNAADGDEGTDTLTSIETLVFDDATIDASGAVQVFDEGGNFVGSFDTIQEGVDASSDGFTLNLAAGEYDEVLTIDKEVTILGAQSGVDGRDAGRGTGESILSGYMTVTADNVTLDGVSVTGYDAAGGGTLANNAIFVSGGDDFTVVNTVFDGPSAGSETIASTAILTSTTANLSVTNSLFGGYSVGAYVSGPNSTGVFSDNLFQGEWDASDPDVFTGLGNAINSESSGIVINDNVFDALYSGVLQVLAFSPESLDLDSFIFDNTFSNNRAERPIQIFPNGVVDTVIGTDENESFNGDQGSSTDAFDFSGNGGNDRLFGATQNDTLNGGTGADSLFGGDGNDVAVYSETLTVSDIAVLADSNPFDLGDQPGWQVTTASEGTDDLNDVEIIQHGGGQILLVGNGGFDTIQDAVDAASDGDVVLVSAGTYTENVTVDKELTIKGANAGIGGTETRGTESTIEGVVTLASDNVTIDGFAIDGGGTQGSAIRGSGNGTTHSNIEIANNVMTGQTSQPILMGFGSGGGIGSSNWSVTDNLITDIAGNNATGIVLFNITGLTITGNTVDHDDLGLTGRRGINLDGIVDGTIADNIVDQGDPAGTSWGIQVSMSDREASNIDITGNTITGTNTGIVHLSQRSTTDLDITGNTISATNAILLNSGSAAQAAPGVVFSGFDITGNIITADSFALFARDLHSTNVNGPSVFDALVFDGNTINSGIVRAGGTDALGGELLNITGDNVFQGTVGNDRIEVEGSGSVSMDMLAGNDTFIGGAGNDIVFGGADDDFLAGGDGNDSLDGGDGTDTLTGGTGDDEYTVDTSADVVVEAAGEGDDTILSSTSFILANSVSVEELRAISGDGLSLIGNDSDNRIYGAAGDDILSGRGGNDLIDGGEGDDFMFGGTGDDTYFVDSTGDTVTEQSGQGTDTVVSTVDRTLSANVENLSLTGFGLQGTGNTAANMITGSDGNDTLSGSGGEDTLIGGLGDDSARGGVGNDRVTGGDGNDTLEGNGEDDMLDGGAGDDVLRGGVDNDSLLGGDGEDVILGTGGLDTILGGAGNDEAFGGADQDLLFGNDGDDELSGNSNRDTLSGGDGNDLLRGNNGNDRLEGEGGDDDLFGGTGDDTIVGGTGLDRLSGRQDADSFVFGEGDTGDTNATADRIADFSQAEGDIVDLAGIDAIAGGGDDGFSFIGDAAFTGVAGELRFEQVATTTFVYGDTDGDQIADIAIRLVGNYELVEADFVL